MASVLRWIGWSMPTLALAFVVGLPAFTILLGMTPHLGESLPSLLIAAAVMSTYAVVCVVCWIPLALWVPGAEGSWKVLIPSFVLMVIVLGQVTAIVFNAEDYSPLLCAAGSAYSAMAVLTPRFLDKKLKPGCFLAQRTRLAAAS